MAMAFVPMLCFGFFLGVLVVVGQASKSTPMQVLTAIVLLSDVLFKIFATMITESADFMLHRRVSKAITEGSNRRAAAEIIGQPVNWADEVIGSPKKQHVKKTVD